MSEKRVFISSSSKLLYHFSDQIKSRFIFCVQNAIGEIIFEFEIQDINMVTDLHDGGSIIKFAKPGGNIQTIYIPSMSRRLILFVWNLSLKMISSRILISLASWNIDKLALQNSQNRSIVMSHNLWLWHDIAVRY